MSSRVITGYKVNRRGRRVPIYGTSNTSNEVKKAETKSTVTESAETVKDKRSTGTSTTTSNKQKKSSSGKSRRKKSGGVLRYPYEALTANTDYLQINIVEYKSVKQNSGGLTTNAGGRRISSVSAVGGTRPRGLSTSALINAGSILLPIPNAVQDGNSVDVGSSKLSNLQASAASGIKDIMDAPGGDDDSNYFDRMRAAVTTLGEDAAQGLGSGGKAADLLKKQLTTQAMGVFGGNITVEQLMARENGEVFNPNMELLFNGPTLRGFKFSWKMMPRNKKEAEQCKLIIRAFKENMAPKTKASAGQGGNWFLKTPNVFELRYMTGNSEHPFLHKFKQCFLTDIAVNYTGEASHMTYPDGTPVSMQMDLSFKELEPIYDIDYEDVEGVGY
tara:strand:+ start:916 stop:2079 length:1164 start_codon:yes stop_codon:yes gene_type:complete